MHNLDPIHSVKPPKSWLIESILATLFCCLPFGIAGIINAAKVESLYYAGNPEAALRASQQARQWTLISFFIGISGIVIYVLLLVFGLIGGFVSRP